jgi:hypothetical protein
LFDFLKYYSNNNLIQNEIESNKQPLCNNSLRKNFNNNNNNNEECASDSSTICAESVSFEQLNLKYNLKVRELIHEQTQYINDLNVLRRIFMYLFKKCCTKFNIGTEVTATNEQKNQQQQQQIIIENIFGNINDLYDCALRLSDLLDDAVSTNTNGNNTTSNLTSVSSLSTFSSSNDLTNALNNKIHQQKQTNNQQQHQEEPLLMVGQQFWELAEGDEFSIYTKYASYVTNFSLVKCSIDQIINNPNAAQLLQSTSSGLVEISKYLLPKLLLSSIYHLLYLFETVEYLQQHATDEEDKVLLGDTLDTLKMTKFKLVELGFANSKRRPIETSFRMFQSQQFVLAAINCQSNNLLTNNSTGLTNKKNQLLSSYNLTPQQQQQQTSLISNICFLTQKKLQEIETNVESFKLPGNTCVYSTTAATNGANNNLIVESTVRNPYLYESFLTICRTSQPIQPNAPGIKLSTFIASQPKLKSSKRFAYLFDGFLILVKRFASNNYSNIFLNVSNNSGSNANNNNKFNSRFKQSIALEKCCLKDHDDECCFELQIFKFEYYYY